MNCWSLLGQEDFGARGTRSGNGLYQVKGSLARLDPPRDNSRMVGNAETVHKRASGKSATAVQAGLSAMLKLGFG